MTIQVEFYGGLIGIDRHALHHAGIEYIETRGEVGPNRETRPAGRQAVQLDADDGPAAEQLVKDALGPRAHLFSEWRWKVIEPVQVVYQPR